MIAAISGSFYVVSIGSHTVFLKAVERCAKVDAETEYAYWCQIFGDGVNFETLDMGGNMVVETLAAAIMTLSKDGAGVHPRKLVDLGFTEDQVTRNWSKAMDLIHGSLIDQSLRPDAVNAQRLDQALADQLIGIRAAPDETLASHPAPSRDNVVPFRRPRLKR